MCAIVAIVVVVVVVITASLASVTLYAVHSYGFGKAVTYGACWRFVHWF